MLSLDTLKTVKAKLQNDLNQAQARLAQLDSDVQGVANARGMLPDYKTEKIDALRQAAVADIGALVSDFDARLAPVKAQRKFWESTKLLMSRLRFAEDPAIDATIRLQRADEFSRMDAETLQLVAENSRLESDWPSLWQAYLAGLQHVGKPGWSGIDLPPAPDQGAALGLIKSCEDLLWLAHNTFARANGAQPTGADKLVHARMSVNA